MRSFTMGKKKKDKKERKKAKKELKIAMKAMLGEHPAKGRVKSNCCEKYKKGENKRCGRCPCLDLAQRVA